MVLSTCAVQLVDIGHYRYHLPEKNRSLRKCNGFVYLCCSDSWHWTLSISLTRQIGAYENAMVLSTCVVQLVDIAICDTILCQFFRPLYYVCLLYSNSFCTPLNDGQYRVFVVQVAAEHKPVVIYKSPLSTTN